MQRKTLLSACIALALSGQGWAADITEVETTTGEKKKYQCDLSRQTQENSVRKSLNAYPLNALL